MNKYRHTQIHDNIVEETSIKEAPYFPVRLFERHPAKEGGDSVIETEDESIRICTREFEEVTILVRATKDRTPKKILSALQMFLSQVE
jgi:hypothetical protein